MYRLPAFSGSGHHTRRPRRAMVPNDGAASTSEPMGSARPMDDRELRHARSALGIFRQLSDRS